MNLDHVLLGQTRRPFRATLLLGLKFFKEALDGVAGELSAFLFGRLNDPLAYILQHLGHLGEGHGRQKRHGIAAAEAKYIVLGWPAGQNLIGILEVGFAERPKKAQFLLSLLGDDIPG